MSSVDMTQEDRHEEHELDEVSNMRAQSKDEERGILPEHDDNSDGKAADPVPNGGMQAWLQVLGSWILFL